VAGKDIGLEVKLEVNTRSCLEIRMQEESHSIKIYNISFERVEEFKYLGKP